MLTLIPLLFLYTPKKIFDCVLGYDQTGKYNWEIFLELRRVRGKILDLQVRIMNLGLYIGFINAFFNPIIIPLYPKNYPIVFLDMIKPANAIEGKYSLNLKGINFPVFLFFLHILFKCVPMKLSKISKLFLRFEIWINGNRDHTFPFVNWYPFHFCGLFVFLSLDGF